MTTLAPLFRHDTRTRQDRSNPKPREHVVSVSGGKDSTAVYLLAIERGMPFMAVFADTGHEHPATYGRIRELEAEIARLRALDDERDARVDALCEAEQS